MKFCIYIQINIQMNDLIFLECSIFSIIVSRVANRECVLLSFFYFIYSVLILLFTSGVMFYDSNIAYFFIIKKFIIWKIMAQNKVQNEVKYHTTLNYQFNEAMKTA